MTEDEEPFTSKMSRLRACVVVLGLASPLCGCGSADSHATYLPAFLRQEAAPPPEIQQPPDVHLVVRNNIFVIFMAAAAPKNISVSSPIPAKYGGWTTCVRTNIKGITGKSIGTQTYLVNIDHNLVGRRERVDNAHWCAQETYEEL